MACRTFRAAIDALNRRAAVEPAGRALGAFATTRCAGAIRPSERLWRRDADDPGASYRLRQAKDGAGGAPGVQDGPSTAESASAGSSPNTVRCPANIDHFKYALPARHRNSRQIIPSWFAWNSEKGSLLQCS